MRVKEYYAVLLSLGPLLEVSATPKPGNVDREHDFRDTRFEDFLTSSLVLEVFIKRGIERGLKGRYVFGDLVLGMVKYSKKIHGGGNTCLGMAILLTPLSVSLGELFRRGEIINVKRLTELATELVRRYSTVRDTINFYKAIREASPSYLSLKDKVEYPNVYSETFEYEIKSKSLTLWKVLEYSARWDIISRQIVNKYVDVIHALNILKEKVQRLDWNRSVVQTYLELLAKLEDSIIIRKHGPHVYDEIRGEVLKILSKGGVNTVEGMRMIYRLDQYMIERGINPGAIADIIAVAISLYAIEKKIKVIKHE